MRILTKNEALQKWGIPEEDFREFLNGMLPKYKEIITLRFGLEDGITHTLKEIGKKFQVSPERIRQIEAKVINRFRYPNTYDSLFTNKTTKP